MSTAETAQQINAAMEEPAPYMGDAPNTEVTLPVGVALDDDWVTLAEVRELTGEDEEYLASVEKKDDLLYAEYMTEVLKRAVVRLGDHDIASAPSILGRLALADRDTLYLGIMKATYGDTREIRLMCPHCEVSNDVLLSLEEDFPIKQPDFDPKEGLTVKSRNKTYRLRLPNGDDMVEVQKNTNNTAEFNTRVLANCALFDGSAPKDRLAWAKKLNVADRRKLIDTLLEIQVGPDLKEVNAQCAECGKDIPLMLDWVSLLLG